LARLAGSFLVFALCLFNLAPAIFAGDSALLTTASYYLGSAHPPAYPLYVTLGKAFTFIPLGSVGWKLNLMSAFFAALCYYMMTAIVRRMTGSKAAALFLSFTPFFIAPVFFESVKAEVYILNVLFCLMIFHLGLRAHEDSDPRLLYLISFLFGLGSGNHHTLAFMAAPVLVVALAYVVRTRDFGTLALIPLFFLSGALVYTHLYLRSMVRKESALFMYTFAFNFRELLDIFLRKTYASSSLDAIGSTVRGAGGYIYGVRNLFFYVLGGSVGHMAAALSGGLLVLHFLGRKHRRNGIYLSLALLPWVVLFPKMAGIGGMRPSAEGMERVMPFFLPLIFFICIVIASGLMVSYGFIALHLKKAARVAPVFLFLPLIYLPSTLRSVDMKNNYLAYDRGRDSLNIAPIKGWLITGGDNPSFTSFYMQWVERLREDILVLNLDRRSNILSRAYSIIYKSGVLHGEGLWLGEGKHGGKKKLFTADELRKIKEMSLSGKLFVTHPDRIPREIARSYAAYNALLLYIVYPGGIELPARVSEFMSENYAKLNYERATGVYTEDELAEEIKNHYGFALFFAAMSMSDSGEKEALDKTALKLVSPTRFVPYFVAILEKRGQRAEALNFLGFIEERFAATKTSDIAHVVEYEYLKHMGDEDAARKKKEYLKENGLLIYLGISKKHF
jgi:hypothetical protein